MGVQDQFSGRSGGVLGQYIAPRYEDLSDQFNTPLSPDEERRFREWLKTLPPRLRSTEDYDLRGAWKANAQAAANGHLPDTWKKPNHPTFSQESQYSRAAQQGGSWQDAGGERFNYWASPANQRYRSMGETSRYFQEAEPDATVIFPSTYRLPEGR